VNTERFGALILLLVPHAVAVQATPKVVEAFSTNHRYPAFTASITHSSVTSPYVVGPTAEIGLPFRGLGVEAAALYRRIGWDSRRAATDLPEPFSATVRAGAGDFSALLKHRFERAGTRPDVAGGSAMRMLTTRSEVNVSDQLERHISKQMMYELRRKNIVGQVASAGIELGRGLVRNSPELRYARWRIMNNIQAVLPLSTQANQVDVLVFVTCGGCR
jgi:hypothetical protein